MAQGLQIHLARAGQTRGPYSFEEVRQHLASGDVLATDWAWHPGLSNWIRVSDLPGLSPPAPAILEAVTAPEPLQETPVAAYHHVATIKFIVYSICSLGLYELFWAYWNWKFIKARDNSRIMPFWRSVFLPLWCYSLTKDIADARGGAKAGVVALVAGAYFVVSILWKLPDPYWLITLANFIPLLYPVKLIDELNRARGVRGPHYSTVKKRHVALCFLGVLLLTNAMLGVFGFTPDTKVVSGANLPGLHATWLQGAGIVKSGETIEYFYSGALFFVRGQGSVVTDKAVAAYQKSDGKLNVRRAAYGDIENIDVTYSESWYEPTQILVKPRDGEAFALQFSTEDELDRRCVQRVMDLWKRSNGPTREETTKF